MTTPVACRLCGSSVTRTFVDLGAMPLANAYLRPDELDGEEPRHPLHVLVCEACLLVQVEELVSPRVLFADYAYFSSYSDSWVEHSRRFAESAISELDLGPDSFVVEVASNDGYLLQHFISSGVPVLGIEPAENVAKVAVSRGVPTENAFFGRDAATRLVEGRRAADLVVANNVLAHVPDLNDFVAGLALAVAPDGVLSIEVPHLLRLMEETQFDTLYHEHFSYFSLLTAERALAGQGLAVFHVEQLQTHGGSLRIWAAPVGAERVPTPGLEEVRRAEERAGLDRIDTYTGFGTRVDRCRDQVLEFLSAAKAAGRTVVAYGAAAKGNTLLNYCGVSAADIRYVADRNPEKQGRLLPGSHLPVEPPERIFETRPDYVLVLPWNLRAEVAAQLAGIARWGGRLVTLVPEVRIHS